MRIQKTQKEGSEECIHQQEWHRNHRKKEQKHASQGFGKRDGHQGSSHCFERERKEKRKKERKKK
jgi:hypothetical protein